MIRDHDVPISTVKGGPHVWPGVYPLVVQFISALPQFIRQQETILFKSSTMSTRSSLLIFALTIHAVRTGGTAIGSYNTRIGNQRGQYSKF